MNTTELIEIARQCGGRYAYTNWGYHPFTLTELQQFAQRIEQPLLERIDSAAKVANAARENLNAKDARIAELELALQKQAKAALHGMDAAKASATAMLKVATETQSQLNPELLNSERQANARLTEENEKLQKQIEQLREALNRLLYSSGVVDSDELDTIDAAISGHRALEQTK